MSLERLSPEYEQKSDIERANEIFAWLQQPNVEMPELGEVARDRFEQLAGEHDPLDVVESIKAFDDEERLAVQLTLSGFDESIIKQFVSDESLELALKKARTLFDPDRQPKPVKQPAAARTTAARKPRTTVARKKSSEESETSMEVDSFGLFLSQIGRTALLDAETEVELSKAIEAGLYAQQILNGADTTIEATTDELEFLVEEGRLAKLRFIEANTRLAVSIAKKYYYYNTELADRAQIGMQGIIRAVEKFDYTKGYKFSTYATWWVKQAIIRGEAEIGTTIRMPIHAVEKLKAIRKLRSEIFKNTDEYPTNEDMSIELGFDVAEFLETVKSATGVVSLNTLVDVDGDTELGDLIASQVETGYDSVEDRHFAETVRDALDSSPLTIQEQEVVWARFGLEDGKPQTLDVIANRYGVSRERIRQIESRALYKLSTVPELSDLMGYVNPADKPRIKVGVRKQERIDLGAALARNGLCLTDEERYIAKAFIEEKNQTDTAKRLGVGVEQVRKSISGIKAKLNLS